MSRPIALQGFAFFARPSSPLELNDDPATLTFYPAGRVTEVTAEPSFETKKTPVPTIYGRRQQTIPIGREDKLTFNFTTCSPMLWELLFGCAPLTAGATNVNISPQSRIPGYWWMKFQGYDGNAGSQQLVLAWLIFAESIGSPKLAGDQTEWNLVGAVQPAPAANGNLALV